MVTPLLPLPGRRFVAVTFGFCAALGALRAQEPAAKPADADGAHNLLIAAVAWKQTAAEYRALYHQGFNVARLHVELALRDRKPGDRPLAVVTDLDDTLVLPLAYWGHLIETRREFFDDAIWDRWIPNYQMTPSPGAAEFLRFCAENGVEVFYVTSRDQGDATFDFAVNTLRQFGFPNADAAHLTVLRETSNKQPRQEEIARTHEIVVMLGDNLNDFRRLYYTKDVDERARLMEADRALFGRKFILFPNPTDGHWMRAIFGDSEPPPSDANRETFRRAAARSAWDGK